MTGRPINESRALALITGDKTYVGLAHGKCGTTERYVSGGGCVHCARIIATEQREARAFIKAYEAEQAGIAADEAAGLGDPEINQGHIPELDADPRSEYERSLDEMM